MKKCTECKIEKSLDEYYNNYKAKDGKQSRCKTCTKNSVKKYKLKNAEKCREHSRKWKQNNKDKIKKNTKKYYEENKATVLERNRVWREKNKDKVNQTAKKYFHDRYNNDINFKLINILRHRLWSAVKTNSKKSSIVNLLGCTIDELKVYLAGKFVDGMTWDNHGEWHIDHIKPCASFDLTKKIEQEQCFHYSNLQPLWAKDNLIKSDSNPDDHS